MSSGNCMALLTILEEFFEQNYDYDPIEMPWEEFMGNEEYGLAIALSAANNGVLPRSIDDIIRAADTAMNLQESGNSFTPEIAQIVANMFEKLDLAELADVPINCEMIEIISNTPKNELVEKLLSEGYISDDNEDEEDDGKYVDLLTTITVTPPFQPSFGQSTPTFSIPQQSVSGPTPGGSMLSYFQTPTEDDTTPISYVTVRVRGIKNAPRSRFLAISIPYEDGTKDSMIVEIFTTEGELPKSLNMTKIGPNKRKEDNPTLKNIHQQNGQKLSTDPAFFTKLSDGESNDGLCAAVADFYKVEKLQSKEIPECAPEKQTAKSNPRLPAQIRSGPTAGAFGSTPQPVSAYMTTVTTPFPVLASVGKGKRELQALPPNAIQVQVFPFVKNFLTKPLVISHQLPDGLRMVAIDKDWYFFLMPGNVLGKSRQQLITPATKLITKLGSNQQVIANEILQNMGNLPAPVPAGAEAIQASQVYQQQTPMFQQPSATPQYQLPPGMVPQYQQPTTPGFQQPSMTPGMYQQPSTMPGFQQPSIFTPAQSQQQVTPSRSLLDSMLNTPSGNVGSSYSPGSLLTGQSQQSGVLTAPGLTGSVTPFQQPPFVSTPGSTSAASILDALASANIRK